MSSRAPRRAPTQARSRETVEVIIRGTDRVLRTVGVDALTMRQIADVSGVSMGTLYQYFPNRESVLAAWEEKALADIRDRLAELLGRCVEVSPPLEVAVFVLANLAFELLHRHMGAYPRGDAEAFFSRTLVRHERQQEVITLIVGVLALARSQERLRKMDSVAAVRAGVKAVMYLARDLAYSPLDPLEQRSLRRQVALMIVHMVVKDADEALLPENDDPLKPTLDLRSAT